MRPISRVIFILLLTFPLFAHAEDRFFDSDGVNIDYVEQGQGEPVVLIHGFSRNMDEAATRPYHLSISHNVIKGRQRKVILQASLQATQPPCEP